jgi:hypothetical protein
MFKVEEVVGACRWHVVAGVRVRSLSNQMRVKRTGNKISVQMKTNTHWRTAWRLVLPLALLLVPGLSAAIATTNATPHGTADRPRERTGGITYFHEEVSDVPWSIHVVKVDRSHPDLRFETTLGGGRQIGMSLVSEQVKLLSAQHGRPLAALNGDFYKSSENYPGDPEGVQIFHF